MFLPLETARQAVGATVPYFQTEKVKKKVNVPILLMGVNGRIIG